MEMMSRTDRNNTNKVVRKETKEKVTELENIKNVIYKRNKRKSANP